MYEYNPQQNFIRRTLRKTILGSMTSFFLRKKFPTEKEITYQLILMSYLPININSFYRPGVNNQLVTIFIIFGDNRMIAVHNIHQDSKILASVVCFAELVYNWFMSRLGRSAGTVNFTYVFLTRIGRKELNTVYPHIRPAGIIISCSLQMRVLLLENTTFLLHKVIRIAGIIRVAGIIRERPLHEEKR